jgi:hypothetical protein
MILLAWAVLAICAWLRALIAVPLIVLLYLLITGQVHVAPGGDR